jgi:transcriptional regulator with XRE-family HTH domain
LSNRLAGVILFRNGAEECLEATTVVVETVRVPRPNPPRLPGVEDVVARRIAAERTLRGWSYADLAGRLTELGCPIGASAVWKIEQEENRRRITVNEAVAFARAFDIDLADFLGIDEIRESMARLHPSAMASRLDALSTELEEVAAKREAVISAENEAHEEAARLHQQQQDILLRMAALRAQMSMFGSSPGIDAIAAEFRAGHEAGEAGTDGEH